MDIRLKERPFELNGKTYMLRCNYNVLADVEAECGGIPDILEGKNNFRNFTVFLAAMVNDYADDMGWPERFTAKQIGRALGSIDNNLLHDVMMLTITACYGEAVENLAGTDIDNSKN